MTLAEIFVTRIRCTQVCTSDLIVRNSLDDFFKTFLNRDLCREPDFLLRIPSGRSALMPFSIWWVVLARSGAGAPQGRTLDPVENRGRISSELEGRRTDTVMFGRSKTGPWVLPLGYRSPQEKSTIDVD